MTYPLINGEEINGEPEGGSMPSLGAYTTKYGRAKALLIARAAPATTTQFGTPAAIVGYPATVYPKSAMTTRYGTPVAVSAPITVIPSAHKVTSIGVTTQYGTHTASLGQVVSANDHPPITMYGTPTARVSGRASSAASTLYGVHAAGAVYKARGACTTRYGTPHARVTAHVPGLYRTRYGVPTAKNGPTVVLAQGSTTTQYGQHSASVLVHVRPSSPMTRYGRPSVLRPDLC